MSKEAHRVLLAWAVHFSNCSAWPRRSRLNSWPQLAGLDQRRLCGLRQNHSSATFPVPAAETAAGLFQNHVFCLHPAG